MLDAVDLFAGPGGWDVAAERLGLTVHGIEFDPAAAKTRRAAGLSTTEDDVRNYGPSSFPASGLIASPPCQTFSTAGKGAGRAALQTVLDLADRMAAREAIDLSAFSDERTGLVLEPLRWALEAIDLGTPYEWLAFEQVPGVLPVWDRFAVLLRAEGYSVTTGNVQAERYGVPQTRKRAVLLASRAGTAELPTPTHSRYYARTPEVLDLGLPRWRTVGLALDDRPAPEVTVNARTAEAFALVPEGGNWRDLPDAVAREVMGAAYDSGGGRTGYMRRLHRDRPSPTILTSPAQRSTYLGHPTQDRPISAREAALLQTFPEDFAWQGSEAARFKQIGNAVPPLLAFRLLRSVLRKDSL